MRRIQIHLFVLVLASAMAQVTMPCMKETAKQLTVVSETSMADVTPPPEQAVTVFGRSYNLTQFQTKSAIFTLTAYNLDRDSTGKNPGDPAFGVTASGTLASTGRTVAVDPHVVPYGTLLFIRGVGWRIAEDTGGAIRGHHIDVLMTNRSSALQFGVQRNREVDVFIPTTR